VHDLLAFGFGLDGAFDRLDLPADAPDSREQLALLTDGVRQSVCP